MMSRIDSELLERRIELSAAVAVIAAIIAAILLSQIARPMVTFSGWSISGWIGFLGYEIMIAGKQARVPPLDSIALISIFLALMMIFTLASAAIAAYGYFSRRELVMLEASAVSAFASAMVLVLTFSVIRVVVRDVIPSIRPSVVTGSAGRLTLDPGQSEWSALAAILDYPIIVLLASILLFLLGAVLVYVAYRLSSQMRLGSEGALEGEAGDIQQINAR